MKNYAIKFLLIVAIAMFSLNLSAGEDNGSSDSGSSDSGSSDGGSSDGGSSDGGSSDDGSSDDGGSAGGMVIIDMTSNPGDVAISVNLDFIADGASGKSDTAIDDGFGNNVINIADYHVLSRDLTVDPNGLKLTVGESNDTVVEDQLDKDGQMMFFSDGNQLFDLDRLRQAADWMSTSGNLTPDPGVSSGTYGTISFSQFLNNIANSTTMYGLVRVKVPVKLGTCTDEDNCEKNALGAVVDKTTLYGFCEDPADSGTTGLCNCAPHENYDIKVDASNCGTTLPSTAQIRVKGSLFWDFVASEGNSDAGLQAGDPVPLSLLPWAPRELYFKVEIPIMVNWANDANLDGAMDNMLNIAAVSSGLSTGTIANPGVTWNMVAPTKKTDFEYYAGQELTQSLYDTLSNASKYHLLMPNGYPDGWAEAFDKLNITGSTWSGIPVQPPLRVPPGYETSVLTANAVRNDGFEDIPTYLYSGGLIDMHDQVNISGLVYVPQGMELEAKNKSLSPPTRQYINGAIVVRDTFFIESKGGKKGGASTVTVIVSDPTTYSTAVITQAVAAGAGPASLVAKGALAETTGSDGGSEDGNGGSGDGEGDALCLTGCSSNSSNSTAGAPPPGANLWIEVRPQIP